MTALRWFDCEHLPRPLQEVVKPFKHLASEIYQIDASRLGEHTDHSLVASDEVDAALRKLLEAKDCAVRAYIAMQDHKHYQRNEVAK